MHVATTTKTTKNPSEKHQNFCQQESGQLDMCKHCTTCWNVFSFLFLINRTPSLLQHGRRHNPKAARKTMHNQLPHFACHMLPALSVARPPADLQPGPEHSPQQDQTLPSQRQVRFSNSRSWLDLWLLCVLSTFISSNHTVVLPDIGNNPMQTTVVMLKHKLNVGYKTVSEP